MNDERIAGLFAEANPVPTWEDAPDPVLAAELIAHAERSAPARPSPRFPARRRRGLAVAAAVFTAVVVVMGAILALIDASGDGPAGPSVVEVTGTSTCDRADWLGGDEYRQSCELDMSDPRVTGTATWQWLVQLEDGTTGTYTGTLEIVTADGTWTGSFTGTSLGSSPTFSADLQGQGAYQGLALELTQVLDIDAQQGDISSTIRPAG